VLEDAPAAAIVVAAEPLAGSIDRNVAAAQPRELAGSPAQLAVSSAQLAVSSAQLAGDRMGQKVAENLADRAVQLLFRA
jgi:hypothetical protein